MAWQLDVVGNPLECAIAVVGLTGDGSAPETDVLDGIKAEIIPALLAVTTDLRVRTSGRVNTSVYRAIVKLDVVKLDHNNNIIG